MLHIMLLILKIIGIVLLCVLGIILLTLLCVLFVPVRYRIEITRKEGEDQPPVVVRVKITWLLRFLNILIRYPAEVMVRVRIMVFTILKIPNDKADKQQDSNKGKKISKKNDKTQTEEKARARKNEKDASDKDEDSKVKADVPKPDKISGEEDKDFQRKDSAMNQDLIPAVMVKSLESEDDVLEDGKSPSFMDKLRALPVIIKKIIQKIKSLFENIQYTIRRLCDKMKSISDNIQYYKDVVESDIFQRSFSLCKDELTAILRNLKPQKFEAKLIIGMDDPAATGKILSICGMLYPVLGGQVDVVGDFERKRIEGRVFMKGKIRSWTFLRTAVRIYFNKDIKKLLKLLKKEAV